MTDVVSEMIDHFLYGKGEGYESDILTKKIREHQNSQKYVKMDHMD